MSDEIEILYQDRHLILVNKPPGIDVHGRDAADPTSLVGQVARQLRLQARKLHPASRLDKPVSGIVPLVRSKVGRRSLTQQYQRREVKRTYIALVEGVPEPAEGLWDGPIGTDRRDPRRRVVNGKGSRPAQTAYRVSEPFGEQWALVELSPRTGRTHQLRVHLAQIAKCPILGDRRYGGPTTVTLDDGGVIAVGRVMLHARRIELCHPESGERLETEAPLWADFQELIERLR